MRPGARQRRAQLGSEEQRPGRCRVGADQPRRAAGGTEEPQDRRGVGRDGQAPTTGRGQCPQFQQQVQTGDVAEAHVRQIEVEAAR